MHTLGALAVTELNILTRTRKRVTSRAILPGTTSGGTMNEIQETTTKRPVVRYTFKQVKNIYQSTISMM
jgi:hypothetical protein